MYDNRPLETLAAFALSFTAGLLSAAALAAYAKWVNKTPGAVPINPQTRTTA